MTDPRIDLKSPWLAGVLAFLIPGAGHLYQGRIFKSILYFVCVLGTYSYGLALGHGQVVYRPVRANMQNYYGFYAQTLVGLAALPAFVQSRRYDRSRDELQEWDVLHESISAPFTGRIHYRTPDGEEIEGKTTGEVTLEPTQESGQAVHGRYVGRLEDGTPIEISLGGAFRIAPKVFARDDVSFQKSMHQEPPRFSASERYVWVRIPSTSGREEIGAIEGTIPRSVWNWFGVPPTESALDDLNRSLGKIFELALVCTWIAGLLNVFAIWDAVEGPAYGYGDEEANEDDTDSKPESAHVPNAAAAERDTSRQGPPQSHTAETDRKDRHP